MKRKKDIGLEYIQSLELRRARTPQQFYYDIEEKFGEKGTLYLDALNRLDQEQGKEHKPGKNSTFYQTKNEDYDMSMFLTGGFDSDIIRQACNWIDSHRSFFGKEILEVGCDCGLMTAFLGREFPESHIVSIDRNQNGLIIAKKNVGKFNVSNVEFVNCSLGDVTDKFDTVFSMRTAFENIQINPTNGDREDWKKRADELVPVLTEYAGQLKHPLKSDGILITIERLFEELSLAWLKALNEEGLSVDLESLATLNAKEVYHDRRFPVVISRIGQTIPDAILENSWLEKISDYNPNANEWHSYNALIAACEKAGDVIDGYRAFMPKTGTEVGKVAYYRLKGSNNKYLYSYLISPAEFLTVVDDIGRETDFLHYLDAFVHRNRDVNGLTLTRITKENQWISEE